MGTNTPERKDYIMENLVVPWRSEARRCCPSTNSCDRQRSKQKELGERIHRRPKDARIAESLAAVIAERNSESYSRCRERGARVVHRLRLLQKIVVVSGVRRQSTGVDVQHFRREMTDEMHIVRDEHERALITFQRERE
jgi:hypothetical protein